MQAKRDIFSKILSIKSITISIMICAMVLYAIVGIVMLFSNEKELYSLIPKILGPLAIIGVGVIVSVICFRKLASSSSSVKLISIITLLLGLADVLLTSLLIWEVIPAFEITRGPYETGYYSPYLSYYAPTISYKLIMSLLIMTLFTFVSMIIMDLREGQRLVRFLKYGTIGIWAVATVLTISNFFVNYSGSNLDSIRMMLLQVIIWIVAAVLAITTFCLARTRSCCCKAKHHDEDPKPIVIEETKQTEYVDEQPILEETKQTEYVDEQPIPDEPPIPDYSAKRDEYAETATPNPLQDADGYDEFNQRKEN